MKQLGRELLRDVYLPDLFFDLENEDYLCLRNVGLLSTDYKAFYP
jgi:hypothetical protein